MLHVDAAAMFAQVQEGKITQAEFVQWFDAARQNSYDRGRDDGYDQGHSQGNSEGYDEGWNRGREAGYDAGYNQGRGDYID
jgi:flagellar biosynthesis/type III secretory pathway protein FliH